jgi:hypothetical protein
VVSGGFLCFCGYLPVKEFPRGFGGYLMNHAVYRNRHPRMLALLLAKAGLKINPVMQRFLLDKLLKRLNDIVGTFDMAGTADTDAEFKHGFSPFCWYSVRVTILLPGP